MKMQSQVLFLLLALSALPSASCSTSLPGINAAIRAPKGLFIKYDGKISQNYRDTNCVDFYTTRQNKSTGFLCSSSSEKFIEDFGISVDPTKDGSSGDKQRFKVATGISAYDMAPTPLNGHTLYTAETDCDEDDGTLYRPTSTCHVAFMPLGGESFIYSNFLIKNHAKKETEIDVSKIIDMWKSIKARGNP